MKEKVFHVKDYANHVGEQTIKDVTADVVAFREVHPILPIILDFAETQVSDFFLERIAGICVYHRCRCVGLGERVRQVQEIQQTGYFERYQMGNAKYNKRFMELVERADFPLLVWDKRREVDKGLQSLSVVQPIAFTSTKFIFNALKARYTQPHMLLTAIQEGDVDIFVRHEVYITELSSTVNCIRFACTLQERTTLDILNGILTGQLPISLFEGGLHRDGQIEGLL